MSLSRFRWLVTTFAALAACGDGDTPTPPLDTADTQVAEDTFVPEDTAPAPDTALPPADTYAPPDTTPPAGTLAFSLLTATGPRADASFMLYPEDEATAYLGEAHPGFQADLLVTTTSVAAGEPATLLLDGVQVATRQIAVAPDGTGQATFEAITLPSGLANVRVAVTDARGDALVADKALEVVDVPCAVEVALTAPDACIVADADADASGLQTALTITRRSGDCAGVALAAAFDGVAWTGDFLPFDGADVLSTTATLGAATRGSQGPVVITAAAYHAHSAALGSIVRLERTLDMRAPAPRFIQPDPALALRVTLAQDQDQDPSNGIQYDLLVAGGADDVTSLAVTLDGAPLAPGLTQSGTWSWPATTFPADGHAQLVATATDACGNAGTVSVGLDVYASQPAVALLAPADGAILLAKDDGDPATASAYELSFVLSAAQVKADASVVVSCRADAASAPVRLVNHRFTADAAEAQLSLAASLNLDVLGKTPACWAQIDGFNPAVSPIHTITLATPAPTLALAEPASGARLNDRDVIVAGYAAGLEGRPVHVTVLDAAGAPVYDAPTGVVMNGAYAFPLPIALADGAYSLTVDASDAYGNLASHAAPAPSHAFTLDATAPSVARVWPTSDLLDPITDPTAIDVDPSVPGYQTWLTWQMDGEAVADGATLCPVVAGHALACKAPEADTFAATWTVTLNPGVSTTEVIARDAWGNASEPLAGTLTLHLDAPAVTIVSPAADLVTAAAAFDLVAHVADLDAGVPIDGADVRLFADGELLAIPAIALGAGDYRFEAIPLTAGATMAFQIVAAFSSEEGASPELMVRQKDLAPSVAITSPAAGTVYNKASASCGGTQQDCITSVALAVSGLEAGSDVNLHVACGSATSDVRATATGGPAVVFPSVTFAHGATCTLEASVEDAAGQSAAAAPVSVRVDRVAPRVLAFTRPANPTLIHIDDAQPGTPGMQSELRLSLAGVEAGQVVSAAMAWTDADEQPVSRTFTHTVTTTTADAGTYVAVFADPAVGQGLVPYPEGLVTLAISLADSAGNPASAAKSVFVQTDRPAARITSPAWLGGAACSATVPCATGICHEGLCWRGWGVADSTVLVLDLAGLMTSTSNLRVCTDAANYDAAAPACASAGYRQMVLADAANGVNVVELSGLAEAPQHLIAEVQPQDGGAWVSSLESDVESARRRKVYVDMTPPVVTAITSASDTEAPLGMLNAAEQQSAGRRYAIAISATEDGPLAVYANGQVAISTTMASGAVNSTIQLTEGANTVYARVTDKVGNISAAAGAAGLVTWSPVVDTIAPTLAFSAPAASPIAAGQSRDIVLASNEQGAAVMLFDAGVQVADTAVIDGEARFAHVTYGLLEDGSHTLTATVADAAGNPAQAATTPSTILVDTTPPSVAIDRPADLAAFTADDDPLPGTAAIETEFAFVPDAGAATWQVKVAPCDEEWGCGNAVAAASGSVAAPGELVTATVALLPTAAVTHYRLDAIAIDAVGNRSTASTRVVLIVQDCVVTLSGLGAGAYLGAAACGEGEGCPIAITGQAAGANCGAVDGLALVRRDGDGDVLVGESHALVGGSAPFSLQAYDGDALNLVLIAMVGEVVVAESAPVVRTVDLEPPVVMVSPMFAGAAPEAGLLNAANDTAAAAGFQVGLSLQASDPNLAGGALERIVRKVGESTTALTASNLALPYAFDNSLASVIAEQLSLVDLAENTVEIEVSDAAGNIGKASFTVEVDATAPAVVALAPIEPTDVDAHRASVTLRWVAVGENGPTGGAVGAYDVRYSRQPIADVTAFEGACRANSIAHAAAYPAPGGAGSAQSVVVGGPDIRPAGDACKLASSNTATAWYFAVRAQDDAGNWGPVTAVSQASTTQLTWKVTRVIYSAAFATASGLTSTAVKYLGGSGANVGDVNGDGHEDIVHGFFMSNAFCLVYGGTLATDLTIDTMSGPNHRCVARATSLVADVGAKELGSFVDALGDVNGDGYADFGVSGKTDAAAGFVAVYLGQQGGPSLSRPDVLIRGIDGLSGAYAAFCGAGRFNGGVVDDIAVGEPASDRLRVIPGSATWAPGQATVVIDLDASGALTTFGVHSFVAQFGEVAWFGNRCQRAGDLLPTPNGGAAADDLLVQQAKNEDSRVIVIPGRPLTGGATGILTKLDGVLTDEDLVAVRLRQDPTPTGAFVNGFGSSFQGGHDLNGDGLPEVVIGHTGRSTSVAGQDGKSVFIFDGAAILAAQGTAIRVTTAGVSPTGNAWDGVNGTVVKADVSSEFRGVTAIGDYDGWIWDGVDTPDLAIANKICSEVQVRYNVETADGVYTLGLFAQAEGNLVNPAATGMFSAGLWVDHGGDIDNDGQRDFVAGTANNGILIVH